MGAKCVIGDYRIGKGDLVPEFFHPDMVLKNNFNEGKKIVLFAESLGLTRSDMEYISKCSTADVIVVCETNKAISGIRKTKKFDVVYSKGYSAPASPFDIGKLIMLERDRDYVHEFLRTNKVSMWMVVKYMVSAALDFNIKSNKKVVAWLDENLYRVNPELLWAYAARMFKPEQARWFKWRYPKKQEKDDGNDETEKDGSDNDGGEKEASAKKGRKRTTNK